MGVAPVLVMPNLDGHGTEMAGAAAERPSRRLGPPLRTVGVKTGGRPGRPDVPALCNGTAAVPLASMLCTCADLRRLVSSHWYQGAFAATCVCRLGVVSWHEKTSLVGRLLLVFVLLGLETPSRESAKMCPVVLMRAATYRIRRFGGVGASKTYDHHFTPAPLGSRRPGGSFLVKERAGRG